MKAIAQIEVDGRKYTATCLRCGDRRSCERESTDTHTEAVDAALRQLEGRCSRGEFNRYHSTGHPAGLVLRVLDAGLEYTAWLVKNKVVVLWNEVSSQAVVLVKPAAQQPGGRAGQAGRPAARRSCWSSRPPRSRAPTRRPRRS